MLPEEWRLVGGNGHPDVRLVHENVMGSSTQIALFVAPVLVLASGFIATQPLELSFSRAEIGTLFLGVLIGAIVARDGRSNWYKGFQLILVYVIITILFYFLPEATQ